MITTASNAGLRRVMTGLLPITLAVQICSFGSSIALARILGASAATDGYFLGLSVPVLTYGILLAAVRLGAIPALTELDAASDRPEFNRACSELVSSVVLASTILTGLVTFAAELLLPLIVANSDVVQWTRLTLIELSPMGVLGATTGALGAILAVRRIFAPAIAVMAIEPTFKMTLTLVFGAQIGVHSLILGNVLGSLCAVVLLWRCVRRQSVTLHLRLGINTPFVRAIAVLSLPLVLSQTVLQVNPVVDRIMASELGSGSVTALELGLRLFAVPTSLVIGALIGPIAATWAARQVEAGWPALQKSVERAVVGVAAVAPPIVVLGIVLRHPLVELIYAGGAYPSHALQQTTAVFGMIVLSLPAQMLVVVFATLFIVQKDAIFPMKIALANVILNVILNFALRPVFGTAGIALGTTVTFTLLVAVYAAVAHRRWRPLPTDTALRLVRRGMTSGAATAVAATLTVAALPEATSRGGALLVVVVGSAAGLAAYALHIGVQSRRSSRPRRAYDVAFYLPSVSPLLADRVIKPAGGAETQIYLVARALAARGVKVCLIAFETEMKPLPSSIDDVDIVPRPPYRAHQRLVGKVREAARIHRVIRSVRSEVVVSRVVGPHIGLVALAAKLARRRFIYSSANVVDFDYERLAPKRRDAWLFRVGVRLADEIIVQTSEQVALCKRAFGRDPIVIRSIAESAQKQQLDPNAFLWIGRLVWYKNPLAFVELARSLPDVTFRMVGVPVPGGEDFAAAIMDSAAEVQNLEFVDPRPRNELMELIARAVAITNTAEFEGMPNILLEGWARGVPALVLTHDPDGVVSRFGLGGFAEGGQQRLVELAAKLWNERHARRELSRRCREYVAAHHSVAVIGSKWEEALSLQRSSEYASPALVEAA